MPFLRRFFSTGARASAGVCSNAPSVTVGTTQATKAAATQAAATADVFIAEAQKAVTKICTGPTARTIMDAIRAKAAGIVAFLSRNPKLFQGSALALVAAVVVYIVWKGYEYYKAIRGASEMAHQLVEEFEVESVVGSLSRPPPIQIPTDECICPISLQPFVSPVVVAPSGITYERKYLEEWMKTNNTDPTTGEVIQHVLPNRALKSLMEGVKEAASNAVSAVGGILEFVDMSDDEVMDVDTNK